MAHRKSFCKIMEHDSSLLREIEINTGKILAEIFLVRIFSGYYNGTFHDFKEMGILISDTFEFSIFVIFVHPIFMKSMVKHLDRVT